MGAMTKTGVPRSAAIYCRISLDKRGEGLGVERQEQLCRKLARARGWTVAEVYVDNDKSAYSGKPRPEYERMLVDIEAGLRDGVIAVDQDRIVRRLRDLVPLLELLHKLSVPLATTDGDLDTSTADGIMRAQILGSVAENESRKRAERVAREAEQAAHRGVPRGSRRPFGYEADKVTIRGDEAELVREAGQWVLDGATITSIARDWNARGVPTRQGAEHGWSASSLTAILRNPRLYGARTYKGEVVAESAWPAILDRETFERVQAKIRRQARPGRAPKQLLTAIAHCGRCGAPMWASGRKQKTGERVARYACIKRPGAPGCGATTVIAKPLEELITQAVLHRLNTNAMKRAFAQNTKPKKPKAELDLVAIDRDLEDLAHDYGSGAISRREWLAAKKPLEERRTMALRQHDNENGAAALQPFRNADVHKTWDSLDTDRQRVVLETLIDQITIKPAIKPGRFTADRVDVVWRV
jgi:DNA invertase Pin-like site-specific DNA recombinase